MLLTRILSIRELSDEAIPMEILLTLYRVIDRLTIALQRLLRSARNDINGSCLCEERSQ